MTKKSDIRCTTPKCVATIAESGERYHMVYPSRDSGFAARCEFCGGKQTDAGDWQHKCATCGNDVEPGTLVGLFVPHRCTECHDALRAKQRSEGRICRACNQPFADCCC